MDDMRYEYLNFFGQFLEIKASVIFYTLRYTTYIYFGLDLIRIIKINKTGQGENYLQDESLKSKMKVK